MGALDKPVAPNVSRDFSCARAPAELKQFRKVTDSVALYVQVSGGRHGGNPVFTMPLGPSNLAVYAKPYTGTLYIHKPYTKHMLYYL